MNIIYIRKLFEFVIIILKLAGFFKFVNLFRTYDLFFEFINIFQIHELLQTLNSFLIPEHFPNSWTLSNPWMFFKFKK